MRRAPSSGPGVAIQHGCKLLLASASPCAGDAMPSVAAVKAPPAVVPSAVCGVRGCRKGVFPVCCGVTCGSARRCGICSACCGVACSGACGVVRCAGCSFGVCCLGAGCCRKGPCAVRGGVGCGAITCCCGGPLAWSALTCILPHARRRPLRRSARRPKAVVSLWRRVRQLASLEPIAALEALARAPGISKTCASAAAAAATVRRGTTA